MSGMIEIRAFMGLSQLFRQRNWTSPHQIAAQGQLTGTELLAMLDIQPEQVEVIFINGKVYRPADAVIQPGDRVALAPPGTPGPYRVLLGFRKMD